MTKKSTKAKQAKKRAEKHKHEHQTEHMQEETARKHRAHWEETVAIIVIVFCIPFLVTGVIWWPGTTGSAKATSNTGLADGTYNATYVASRPTSQTSGASAALNVNGQTIIVNDYDLSGSALANSSEFFQGQPGQSTRITVKNGYITDFTAPK